MFTRGFKNWCETVSLQRRRLLGLQPTDPLDPRKLAQSMKVAIHTSAEVPDLDPETRQAIKADSDSWSAFTMSDGARSVIVLHEEHRGGRVSSDLMHELAHILIGHSPGQLEISPNGALMLHMYGKQQEDEATWLGGALLLPRVLLMSIRHQRLSDAVACTKFAVSQEMLNYRMRVTGVDFQLKRAAGFGR